MLLAVAALIAALAGSAVAVDKITSKDIAKDAVRSKHIKDGQVKTRDADLVKHAQGGTLNTTGTSRVTAGSAISVQAKRGDLLHVQARVAVQRTAGTGQCVVALDAEGAGEAEQTPTDAIMADGASPSVYWLSAENGHTLRGRAIGRTIGVSDAGPYRISLTYNANNDDTNCTFSDRNLWVEHSR
jgi:hypothetical protein